MKAGRRAGRPSQRSVLMVEAKLSTAVGFHLGVCSEQRGSLGERVETDRTQERILPGDAVLPPGYS